MLADFQLFPVALFTVMNIVFLAAMLYAVMTDRDPA
jgi:hypothetical protein